MFYIFIILKIDIYIQNKKQIENLYLSDKDFWNGFATNLKEQSFIHDCNLINIPEDGEIQV